jgi:hypothetical protein
MRRPAYGLFGLLALVAVVILGAGCAQDNVLRVVSINGNLPVEADLVDFGLYTDPTDPEAEPEVVQQTLGRNTEVEFQYVEIGTGLPTLYEFQAMVYAAKIAYKSALTGEDLGRITMPMNVAVLSDPTGRRTARTDAQLVPASWLIEHFGDAIDEASPEEYSIEDDVDATITFQAVDSVSGRSLEAIAKFRIVVGNLYDDPSSLGD